MAEIPIGGYHRGVGLHCGQGPARLRVVTAELDHVLDGVHGLNELYAYVCDAGNSPEARVLAGAKISAVWELAAEERRARPILSFDLAEVAAITAGLTCTGWQHPAKYCCLVEDDRFAVEREQPLP